MPVAGIEAAVKVLAAVWREVLDREVDVAGRGFVSSGGTSLLAARSVLEARRNGVHISVHEMLSDHSIVELARRAQGRSEDDQPITSPGDGALLSVGQEAMLSRRRRSFVAFTARVDGEIDVDALRRAVRNTALVHDVLRMRVSSTGRARIDGTTRAFPHLHVTSCPATRADADSVVSAWLSEFTGSDENSSALYCRAGGFSTFAFVADHLVFDGESVRPFLADLAERYGNPSAAGVPNGVFAAYARAQRSAFADLPETAAHWRRVFAELGPFPAAALPGLSPRAAAEAPQALHVAKTVDREVVERFEQSAAMRGCTPFVAHTAAFSCATHRLVGEPTRIGVNTATAGRSRPGTEQAIGPFADVITVDLGTSTSDFEVALTAVRRGVFDALAHDRVARAELLRRLWPEGSRAREPFVWITPPLDIAKTAVRLGERVVLLDVRLHLGVKPTRRHYPGLSLEIEYGDETRLVCEYGESEYTATDAGRLLDEWTAVIVDNGGTGK
ncbi:hypothetical protein ALI22I_08195 [Saccharothrix sp. ALI-22-I]|uniref:condensation domain-containing protein n=1 Tax=Saccharothrix sp. ALI-22-I TaxID=1933778 RepID=UPI00097C28A2|nr:condensation domain-containing protein [Saccharothrix sp. ALI-22-I]ONI91586.1 hypothetical protein ALI22I_08195 [Saccharothrix sp. ALI-22-I]